MEITVKRAGMEDLDTLMNWRMEVLREVFAVPEQLELKELEKANRRYYQTMLETGGHIACFACQRDKIIGCGGICIYQDMPSPDNPTGQCAYLMNIYTRPRFRQQGVGEKIVNWLIGQSTQLGITKIYLETSDAGRQLYQRIGFSPMPNYMKLKKRTYRPNPQVSATGF